MGDPLGIYSLARWERRQVKSHAAVQEAGRFVAVCGYRTAFHFVEPEDVTCRACLYWLGRYVPLRMLREHQAYQRMRAEHA